MDTSVSDSPKRKPRNALTLAERIKVIERKEKGDVVEYMMRLADDIQKQRLRKRTIESKQSFLTTYLDKD